MLGWIPLVGPIIQGLLNTASGIYTTFKNTQLGMRQQDSVDAQTAAQIIRDTNDDIGLRIIRDAALVMPVVWGALIGWDTIVALRYPWLKFGVADYPTNVQYIPYAAYAFLFGILGMNIWKRR